MDSFVRSSVRPSVRSFYRSFVRVTVNSSTVLLVTYTAVTCNNKGDN